MANNTLLASDSFVSGNLAAGWAAVSTLGTEVVVAGSPNVVSPPAINTNYGQMWTGVAFPKNQISEATITLTSGVNIVHYLFVRIQSGSWSGYSAGITNGNAYIQSFTSGTPTTIAGPFAVTFAANDVWSLQAQGSVISLYRNGTLIGKVSDTTYTSGSPGFGAYSSTVTTAVKTYSWRGYSGQQQDGVWTKQGVIMPATSTDSYAGTAQPFVIYDSNPQILAGPNVYKMWFEGGGPARSNLSVYYAESADGFSWTRHTGAVLSGFDSASIAKVGSTYYMVTQPSVAGGDLQMFSSTDGINWSLVTSTFLAPGGSGAWDQNSFATFAAPVFYNGNWYQFYMAGPSGGPYELGVAISATSSITSTYTKSASNPLASNIVATTPVQVGTMWYMWVPSGPTAAMISGGAAGSDPSTGVRWKSSDLIHWSVDTTSVQNKDFCEAVNTQQAGIYPNSILDVAGKATLYSISAPEDDLSGPWYQISAAVAPVPLAQLVTQPENALAYSATDAFARSAGGLGANWSTPTGTTGLQIASSGIVEPGITSTNCVQYYNGTFSQSQFSEITIQTLGAGGGQLASPTVYQQASGLNCYYLEMLGPTGTLTTVRIRKLVSGSPTTIGVANLGLTPTVGDKIRLEVNPGSDGFNVLSAYQNGHLIGQVQDYSNQFTSGNPGIILYGITLANTQISAWAGGNASVNPFFSPFGNGASAIETLLQPLSQLSQI